jgi:hypothetical protein
MKKSKIIKIVILVIILLIIAFAGYKYYHYSYISKIVKRNIEIIDGKNFYYEVEASGDVTSSKIWVNGDNLKFQRITENAEEQYMYVNSKENITYTVSENEKNYIKQENVLMLPAYSNSPYIYSSALGAIKENNFINKIMVALSIKNVSTETKNGIECIKITSNLTNETAWFDKENLTPVATENNDFTANYVVTSNNITDEDVTFSNIENYQLLENE